MKLGASVSQSDSGAWTRDDGFHDAASRADLAVVRDTRREPFSPATDQTITRKTASGSRASAIELKLVLDFDGVLFNSAFEAFSVCNRAVAGAEHHRQDVDFNEFMRFRAVTTDAWQYNRLYDRRRLIEPARLPDVASDDADWVFSRRFFAARDAMMADPDWPKLMAPYDFFLLLRPLLLAHPERFAILSTRNIASIRRTLAFYDADVVPVFGQEDIRSLGSKIAVAEAQGWLAGGFLVVYVDDMNAHLEPFEGRVHLPLHAGWGYDQSSDISLTQHHVFGILSSLLKLSDKA